MSQKDHLIGLLKSMKGKATIGEVADAILDWHNVQCVFTESFNHKVDAAQSFTKTITQANVDRYADNMKIHGEADDEDLKRYGKSMLAIFNLMSDKQWRTPHRIAKEADLNISVTSIAIALRAMREPRYGSHKLKKMRTGNGMEYKYRLVVNETEEFNSFIKSQLAKLEPSIF